jgi:hypothetical protein
MVLPGFFMRKMLRKFTMFASRTRNFRIFMRIYRKRRAANRVIDFLDSTRSRGVRYVTVRDDDEEAEGKGSEGG